MLSRPARRLISLFTFVVAVLVAQAAWAQTCDLSQVTEGNPSRSAPSVNDNGDMVWQEYVAGYGDVMYYDAATGAVTNLTQSEYEYDWDPVINNAGDVAWITTSGSTNNVMLYRAATGTILTLDSGAPCRNVRFPDINDAGDVVWSEDPCNQQRAVWKYSAASGTVSQITDGSVSYVNPKVNNRGDMAWSLFGSSYYDRRIFAYEADSGAITQITADDQLSELGNINDAGEIVYTTFVTTNTWSSHRYDLDTGATEHLAFVDASGGALRTNQQGDLAWATWDGVTDNLRVYEAATGLITDVTDYGPFGNVIIGGINENREVALLGSRYGGSDPESWDQIRFYSPTQPLADAGEDTNAPVHLPVMLNGSGSCDPNADPLAYHWELVSAPPGSQAALDDPTAQLPTLTVDMPGEYVARLRVDDGDALSVPSTVTVTGINLTPVADAGPDQMIELVGTTVQLDGSASYDGDGDALTYSWTLFRPSGSQAELSDPAAVNPTFVADVGGYYNVRLTVTDVFGAQSYQDAMQVSFDNVAPVPDAGENQAVYVGYPVELDGSGSSDANGETVRYFWTLESAPEDSIAWLNNPNTVNPTFFADVPGEYVVAQEVRDHQSSGGSDTVTIVATDSEDAAAARLMELIALINESLPRSAFKHPSLKKWLTQSLNEALLLVDADDFAGALVILGSNVVPRTDGCAILGRPDRNDWLAGRVYRGKPRFLNHRHDRFGPGHGAFAGLGKHGRKHRHHRRGGAACESQELVYPLLQEIIDLLNLALNTGEPPPPPPPPGGGGGL